MERVEVQKNIAQIILQAIIQVDIQEKVRILDWILNLIYIKVKISSHLKFPSII